MTTAPRYDAVVIGGFGHAGLPLALFLAGKGRRTCAMDLRAELIPALEKGKMPFREDGADDLLPRVMKDGRLSFSADPRVISETDTVVVMVGTPVDEHLNPKLEGLKKELTRYLEHFRDGQLLILRSTVYPGTSEGLSRWLQERGKKVDVAFCPERIAQGKALKELGGLPQIVSAFTPEGQARAKAFFEGMGLTVMELKPVEAELAKLFTNAWRYFTFAAANQFFEIANDFGADYYRIHEAMTKDYARAKGIPTPGFAAGPCLFKDTMQLGAWNNNSFFLGHVSMLVNEGLPNYIVSRLTRRMDLKDKAVGVLGMAFKADIDDARESLSYKLAKVLSSEARAVLMSDPFIADPRFVPAEKLLQDSDLVIIGTPHQAYRSMAFPKGKEIVDIWNLLGKGCRI